MKRLCDHVIQDRMGHPDLEWAWLDDRALDPAEQAKLLDLYVRSGVYTINEARAALGLDPVPGGDAARIYGTAGATPLAPPAAGAATKRAAALGKEFNPDQPRVPAGNPDGGQRTDGAGGGPEINVGNDGRTGPNGNDAEGNRHPRRGDPTASGPGTEQTNTALLPIAYPGDYHDAVVQQLKNYLTANGGKVITGITLTAINGTSAVADMIVRLPNVDAPFIVEVKTGPGAQFTDPQRVVYPMAQVGRHVSSSNAALRDVGLIPGELRPPLDVDVYWVINAGERGRLLRLPRPEVIP